MTTNWSLTSAAGCLMAKPSEREALDFWITKLPVPCLVRSSLENVALPLDTRPVTAVIYGEESGSRSDTSGRIGQKDIIVRDHQI